MKVNVIGFIDRALGLGQSARTSIEAFQLAGIDCTATNILGHDHLTVLQENPHQDILTEHPDAPINLIHMNPDCLHALFTGPQKEILSGKYNIGFWFWETDIVPKEWHYAYDLVDEIWVASDFNYDVFRKSSTLPVIKMPTAITVTPSLNKENAKKHFGLENKFVFLACFDFNSSIVRKNIEGIIDAFKRAFPKNDHVRLVFKTQHFPKDSIGSAYREWVSSDSRILSIDKIVSSVDMANLKNACDCYVSLHRSEGFGLNIAEAMALGKPVIATGYSGNLDFTKPNNAYLVDHQLISMKPKDYYCATDAMRWAEPDMDHAVSQLRDVYDDYGRALLVGERAYAFMVKEFSCKKVSALYRKRISETHQFLALKID